MELRDYINEYYCIPSSELKPGCDATRGALQRFSNDIGVPYQRVQRWIDSEYVVDDGWVVSRKKVYNIEVIDDE